MKRIIFSLMAVLIVLSAAAQNYNLSLSGTITEDSTSIPIPGQMVQIMIPGDSLGNDFVYFNMVFTNEAGYYEDNVEVPVGTLGVVITETFDCNGNLISASNQFSENNSAFVNDFQICGNPGGGGGEECQAMFDYWQGDTPLTINFFDVSFGNPDTWSWDFGDGNYSDEQNPVHLYGAEGDYIVNLTISSDSTGCSSTMEMPIRVGNDTIWPGECMAMYYFYNDSNSVYTINFVDMSFAGNGGTPDSWAWSFGDGTGSDEQNPTHTFASEGEYEVCLTISSQDSLNGDTCENTFCSIVFVGDWMNDCDANFYYFPAFDSIEPVGGFAIQFIDDSWGNPTSWLWDFGDGNTSTEQNPVHAYADNGIYQTCLTISSDSCSSTFCQDVFVENDTIGNCFSWFDYSISDLTVNFNAYSEGDDNNVEYFWDFGDGVSGNGQNIEHTYLNAGMYMVNLFAERMDSTCSSVYTEMIFVGENFEFSAFGNVFLDNGNMADYANVYLMTFDTIGNGLITVDTTQVDSAGYYMFTGLSLENCIYFIQAELTDASAYYGDYLPTYHLDALNWTEAMPVFPLPSGFSYDIFMIADSNLTITANGNIDGVVSNNDGRSLMSEVEILLMDENMNPITYVKTDSDGNFNFSDLPYGTYIVYTEIVGVETSPATIVLTEENPSASINIIVANGEAFLGIDNESKIINNLGQVSPNPVTENSTITISLNENSRIKVDVYNQMGQLISSENKTLNAGENRLELNTSVLPEGMYILNITPDDGVSSYRKFIKLR